MMPYLDALDNIHMPKSLHLLKAARERLAMEECMALQVRTLVSYYPPTPHFLSSFLLCDLLLTSQLEMYRQRWHQQLTLLRDSDFNLCQVASSRCGSHFRLPPFSIYATLKEFCVP
jgi:hypothetical protein